MRFVLPSTTALGRPLAGARLRPAKSFLGAQTPVRTLLTRKGAPKIVSADEAVASVRSGERVYMHGVAAFPTILAEALAKRAPELQRVEICHLHLEEENPCSKPGLEKSFWVNNFFIGANQRKPVADGRSTYIPVFLSEVPALMRNGLVRPDWAFLNLSYPDKHGFCSFGTEVAAALPAAETAKRVVAIFNKSMPRTHGHPGIHINAIDYAVEADIPIPTMDAKPPTDAERRIGEHLAGIIQDGATLQMGIGAIPNAVLSSLTNHKRLGVHTEMFADGVIDLVEKGVITNEEKFFIPGRIVTSFCMGSQRIYDFINDNPYLHFADASVTNNPVTIGSNPKVTAINSAIEVDLTGQVCADSVGVRMISGVGGQIDFERGAAISKGGLPVIALTATSGNGQSRIVPLLQNGAGVITTRQHVHFVVTEYGIAYLFGKDLWRRARELIKIAAPEHREALAKAAFERYKVDVMSLI